MTGKFCIFGFDFYSLRKLLRMSGVFTLTVRECLYLTSALLLIWLKDCYAHVAVSSNDPARKILFFLPLNAFFLLLRYLIQNSEICL